jgi:hypothetical protein
MSVQTIDRTHVAPSSSALPGWCTIASGVLMLGLGFPLAHFQATMPWWIAALNAISHLLLLVGVIELARLGVAGRGRLATAGLWLTVAGLGVLTVAEGVSQMSMGVAVVFYSVATLVMILGLILLGVAVVRAGCWTGWYRFTPLACGLFMLLVVLPALSLPGYASNYAIGLWGVCWLLFGWSLLVEGAGQAGDAARGR